jgi:hypothetical protein
MARQLRTIARDINENHPGLRADIVEGYLNTDTPVGRLRIPGKGRYGNRIIVRRESDGAVVLNHNAADDYRRNEEVESWLARLPDDLEELRDYGTRSTMGLPHISKPPQYTFEKSASYRGWLNRRR